jgi:hypothetical protein
LAGSVTVGTVPSAVDYLCNYWYYRVVWKRTLELK